MQLTEENIECGLGRYKNVAVVLVGGCGQSPKVEIHVSCSAACRGVVADFPPVYFSYFHISSVKNSNTKA